MKKNNLIKIFLVICLSLFTISCSDDNPTSSGSGKNSVTFDFSGYFTGKFISDISKTTIETAPDLIIIKSRTADDKYEVKFEFTNLPKGISEIDLGTSHGFKNCTVILSQIVDLSTNDIHNYAMFKGTIRITENSDKAIKGIFNISTGDIYEDENITIEMKNGYFYMNK